MKRKILVTGLNPERYRGRGEVIHHPMIRLVPIDFKVPDLNKYDWIIFTSKFGVKYFFERSGLGQEQLKDVKICAIGRATAKILEDKGFHAAVVAKEESAEGIVKELKNVDLKGKAVLIPRSDLARDYLPVELGKLGAKVDTIDVYRNVKTNAEKIDLSDIDEIVFTSSSTVRNFMELYGSIPERIQLDFIGDVTRNEFSKYKT